MMIMNHRFQGLNRLRAVYEEICSDFTEICAHVKSVQSFMNLCSINYRAQQKSVQSAQSVVIPTKSNLFINKHNVLFTLLLTL